MKKSWDGLGILIGAMVITLAFFAAGIYVQEVVMGLKPNQVVTWA